MPIYFAAVVGTGLGLAAGFPITPSSLIILPKEKPGDYGRMEKTAFSRLMSLDTLLYSVNESVMVKKMLLCIKISFRSGYG